MRVWLLAYVATASCLTISSARLMRRAGALLPNRHSHPVAQSFEDALSEAPALCETLQSGGDAAGLAQMLGTSSGARGFFVHYLTNEEYTVADEEQPPAALAAALLEASAETLEVMLMNVVMSSASAASHAANGDAESAAASELTCARASLLVRAIAPRKPELAAALESLRVATAAALAPPESIKDDEAKLAAYQAIEAGGEAHEAWAAFLERWYYDEAQLTAASCALASCEPEAAAE